MGRKGFLMDIGTCIGCKACQVACKDRNRLEVGIFYRRVGEVNHQGQRCNYSGACNHCAQPRCVENCPTGALYTAVDGKVLHHGGQCIGCGACTWSCPYGAPKLSGSRGISQKCDGCRELEEAGEGPACVQACITHCLQYVDLEWAAEAYRDSLLQPDFLPQPTTDPSLLVINSRKGRECHE